MGENDVTNVEVENTPKKRCEYRDTRRDCDGDWDHYCHNYDGKCPYMKCVRDVDRDIVQLCRM